MCFNFTIGRSTGRDKNTNCGAVHVHICLERPAEVGEGAKNRTGAVLSQGETVVYMSSNVEWRDFLQRPLFNNCHVVLVPSSQISGCIRYP